MRKIKLILLFLVVSLFGTQIFAADSCALFYKDLGKTIEKGFVSQDTRDAIDAVFSNPNIPYDKKAETAFNLFIEDRLKLIDKDSADNLRKLLKERINRSSAERHAVYGMFKGSNRNVGIHDKDSIDIIMPNSLRDSVVEYAAITHEFEHAIQTEVESKHFKQGFVPAEIFRAFYYGTSRIYEQEAGAMMSEFEFLNTVPASVKTEMIKVISEDKNIPGESKKLTLQWLKSSATNATEHVAEQRNLNRYSISNSRYLNVQNMQNFATGVGMHYGPRVVPPALLLGGYGMYKYCQGIKEKEKSGDKSISPVVQGFCTQFPN